MRYKVTVFDGIDLVIRVSPQTGASPQTILATTAGCACVQYCRGTVYQNIFDSNSRRNCLRGLSFIQDLIPQKWPSKRQSCSTYWIALTQASRSNLKILCSVEFKLEARYRTKQANGIDQESITWKPIRRNRCLQVVYQPLGATSSWSGRQQELRRHPWTDGQRLLADVNWVERG